MANEATGNAGSAPATGDQSNQTDQSSPQLDQQNGGVQSKPPQQPKSWKSKVDGQEVTWQSEEELLQDAGLGKAAMKRMREASDLKKNVESFWKKFQEDPMSALEDPSLKLSEEKRRELIEKYYQKKYMEADKLTPEQKRIRELEEREAQRAKKDEEVENQKKSEARAALETQWRETYQEQIIEAINVGKLPKKPYVAARVARHMAHAAEAGFDAPLSEIVKRVRQDLIEENHSNFGDEVPVEVALELLPPNFLKRLRKYDIEQFKARQNKLNPTTPPAEPPARRKTNERLPYSEVLKRFG